MAADTASAGRYRLGVDIGGTFTDVVLECDDGSMTTTKVLTTPQAPDRGVLEGIALVRGSLGFRVRRSCHPRFLPSLPELACRPYTHAPGVGR